LATLWSCLMFSSGMPVLYLIATLFFIIMYWLEKLLIFKLYKKSSSFNEELALKAIGFIRIGLFMHVLVAGFIYTCNGIIRSSSKDEFD
jgi:NADH:ubiquinone oxidoreductase subunit 3 (subunit A)